VTIFVNSFKPIFVKFARFCINWGWLYILFFSVVPVQAQIDDVQLNLSEKQSIQIRWYNVDGDNEWLSGKKPVRVKNRSFVSIEKDQQIQFKIPPAAKLRIISDCKCLLNDVLKIEQSQDGRIFLQRYISKQNNGPSWLLDQFNNESSIVRLTGLNEQTLQFEIYYSLMSKKHKLVHYRSHLDLNTESQVITSLPDYGSQTFNHVQADEIYSLDISGPANLEIQVRRPFTLATPFSGDVRLDVMFDDKPDDQPGDQPGDKLGQSMVFNYRPELTRGVLVNGFKESVSTLARGYLSIPEGQHKLQLRSYNRLYLRVLKQEAESYAYFDFNKPQWLNDSNDKKQQGSLSEFEWYHQTKLNNQNFDVLNDQKYHEIQQHARDNRFDNSGLSASNQLRNYIYKNPHQPSLKALSDVGGSRYGHYSNLLPAASDKYFKHRTYRYTGRRLLRPDEQDKYRFNKQIAAHYIQSLPEGNFHTLDQSHSMRFTLPVTNQFSYIRLILLPDAKQDVPLLIEFDNGEVFNFNQVAKQVAEHHFKSSIITAIHKDGCCEDMLYKGDASEIKQMGVIELPVKPDARSFKVTSASKQSTWLAAQVYVSDPYQLDEEIYIQKIQQLNSTPEDLRQLILAYIKENKKTDTSLMMNLNELQNHWLPQTRRYALKYQSFIQDLNIERAIPRVINAYSEQRLFQLKQQSLLFESKQQWLLALESWGEIIRHTRGEEQSEALFKLVNAMQRLGLNAQVEKLLAALALQQTNKAINQRAASLLLTIFSQQQAFNKAADFLLALYLYHDDKAYLPQLIYYLVEDGQWSDALQWTHLLDESLWPYQSVLLAAGRLSWWQTYEQALKHLPDDLQRLWQGHRSAFNGNYESAKIFYQQADAVANDWYNFSKDVLTINSRVNQSESGSSVVDLSEWQNLRLKSPSNKFWKNADWAITRHAGGVNIVTADGQRGKNYSSRPGEPVELELVGPVSLQLAVRPLFNTTKSATNSAIPLNGEYQTIINGQEINLPVNHALPSETAQIQGSSQRPGLAIKSEYTLSAGIHKIKVTSSQPMLVKAKIKAPVIPLPGVAGMSQKTIIDGYLIKQIQKKNQLKTESDFNIIEPLAYKQMRQYFEQAQQPNANHNEILSQAEQLYHDNKAVPGLRSLLVTIRKSARWELHTDILKSAGIRQIEHLNWQPESPTWREQSALFSLHNKPNRILRSGDKIGIAIFNTTEKIIRINAQVIAPWFIKQQPIYFHYQIDHDPVKKVRINGYHHIPVRVPAGRHYLNVTMSGADYNQYLWMQLTEQDGQAVNEKQRRKYYIATHNEPLEVMVEGPAWLRIDRLNDNNITHSEYQFIANKKQILRFKPEPDQAETLLRVFLRVSDSVENRVAIPRAYKKFNVSIVDTVKPVKQPLELNLIDNLALGKQQDGTFSYTGAMVKRVSVEDEIGSDADSYLELDGTYRYYDPYRNHWYRLTALARVRGENNDSLGIKARVRGRLLWAPLDWDIKASGFTQQLENSTALSARLDFSMRQLRRVELKSYHIPKFNVFVRAHRLTYSETEFIDADLYTEYKNDHLNGLRLSDTFVYQPYLDQEIYAGIKMTSNEGFKDLDNHGFTLGWRQLLGNTRLDIKLKNTFYHKDQHRLQAENVSTAGFNLAWEQWRNNRHRIEMRFNYQYDFNIDDYNIRLDFVYHKSAGRDFRDFVSDKLIFRKLRETHVPGEPNNVVY